ncbi:uncharacterized protein BJ212DRAFT_1334270 [Suillus subaureus]|uniref:Uncharacterized protein n=1 Tax=Suillus subaureus TaxID=48587 RepID=A0A9P7EHK2_9AGAM|nr:uncharacterized protein BJ212DRAFT_1334270 [Suillus subaureus]KAG1821880.1 hypothetical protein BJ212DRAFT_1334270 [Suillus subaureus]
MFMALEHSSQDTYAQIREAVIECYPDSDVPPFYHIKTILADLNYDVSRMWSASFRPDQIHEVQWLHQESTGCFSYYSNRSSITSSLAQS